MPVHYRTRQKVRVLAEMARDRAQSLAHHFPDPDKRRTRRELEALVYALEALGYPIHTHGELLARMSGREVIDPAVAAWPTPSHGHQQSMAQATGKTVLTPGDVALSDHERHHGRCYLITAVEPETGRQFGRRFYRSSRSPVGGEFEITWPLRKIGVLSDYQRPSTPATPGEDA